jgi:hypothetical protein
MDAQVHFYEKWLNIKNVGVALNLANYLPKIKGLSFCDSFCVFEAKNRKSLFVVF